MKTGLLRESANVVECVPIHTQSKPHYDMGLFIIWVVGLIVIQAIFAIMRR